MLTDHLEKLVHFVGVVKAGSMRSYAVKHNLSQPAISKAVQILEADLGLPLLVRNQQGVELTQAGQELFRWSNQLLDSANAVSERIKEKDRVRFQGTVRMGAYESIAVYFLPSFYKFLSREQKKLRLEFTSAPSGQLVESVKAGRVDFIISVNPPPSRELYQLKLFDDFYSLYKSANSQLKEDPAIFTFPQAEDENGRSLKEHIRLARLEGRLVGCGDFEAAKAMVVADAGWALLPDRVAAPLLESKRILRVHKFPRLERMGRHSIAFSCKAKRATEPSLAWLANQLKLMLESRG